MAAKLENYHFYQHDWDSYQQLHDYFEFEIPNEFNIAEYVCDRWVDGNSRVAVFTEYPDGTDDTHTFWQLQRKANQFANYLDSNGIGEGDRVAVGGAQKPETLITHLGTWKVGAESVPLSSLFGPDGLHYRLCDSETSAFVIDETTIGALRNIVDPLPDLEHVLVVGDTELQGGEVEFGSTIAEYGTNHETASKSPEEPATVLYTSGTTGAPKGTVIPHQIDRKSVV